MLSYFYVIPKEFAKLSKNLILVARRKNELERLKNELSHQYPGLDIVVKVADLAISANSFTLYSDLRGYNIELWVNNAGFGDYSSINEQDLDKIQQMLKVNVEALTILTTLYVKDYENIPGAQVINVSSGTGYNRTQNMVTYGASKFFVSAFTEGLATELKNRNALLQAKVLAPSSTKTAFAKVATDNDQFSYEENPWLKSNTSEEMAHFLIQLYQSDQVVGKVSGETLEFRLSEPLLP